MLKFIHFSQAPGTSSLLRMSTLIQIAVTVTIWSIIAFQCGFTKLRQYDHILIYICKCFTSSKTDIYAFEILCVCIHILKCV